MSLLLLLKNSGSAAPSLALDSLSTGLLSAWGLRKLRTAYTGPCARIRRVSDNVEQDIGFSGEHFDTASFSSFIGVSSGTVVTLYDQFSTRNFSQATTTKQPTLTLAAQNSHPVMTFNLANLQCLTVVGDKSYYNDFHQSGKGTLYIVSDNNSGLNKVVIGNINQIADRGFWIYRTSAGAPIIDVGRSIAGGVSSTTYSPANLNPSILSCLFDATNATVADRTKAWEDGAALTGSNALTNAGTDGNSNYDLTLGSRGAQANLYLDGWVSELVMWSGDMTANRTTWEDNAKTYWGTP